MFMKFSNSWAHNWALFSPTSLYTEWNAERARGSGCYLSLNQGIYYPKVIANFSLPREQNCASANNVRLTTSESVYSCWRCCRSHRATEMLIQLLCLKVPWETYIWADCWVNMTARIMEPMHSEEKQHRFSEGRVNNRAIVSLHGGQAPYCWGAVCANRDQHAVLMFSSWVWTLSRT